MMAWTKRDSNPRSGGRRDDRITAVLIFYISFFTLQLQLQIAILRLPMLVAVLGIRFFFLA
jgi:hypothetical protein